MNQSWWGRRGEARRGEVIAGLLAGMGSGLVIDLLIQAFSSGVYRPNLWWLPIGGVGGMIISWFVSLDPALFDRLN